MASTTTAPAPSATGGTHPATRTAQEVARDAAAVVGSAQLSNTALRTFLHGLPGADAVGLTGRATQLGARSLKTTSKAWGLDVVARMVDLAWPDGADTPSKARPLVANALAPDPGDTPCPRPAAVCVYGDRVTIASEALGGAPVAVAAVATGFPAGRSGRAAR